MSNTRVRKPPGGDSSFNIFGIPNEPNEAKKNNQKAADNSTQKATDNNNTEKATDNSTQKATENEETHVTTDGVVAKDAETCQKAEDKNDDDKEKKDAEAEEEEQRKKKEEEELKLKKDAADQNSLNVTPASVDVKDSPTKNESQNTPESTKNKPKAAYNPITGEQYGSPEKTETANKTETAAKSVGPTRVRQPPGGASSKLW